MGLFDIFGAYKSPLTLLLVLFGPSLLPRLVRFFLIKRQTLSQPPTPPRPPLTLPTIALLSFHTIYIVSRLFKPPYDLFTSSQTTLFGPNVALRNTLLGPSYDPSTSSRPLEELLLSRLQNLDTRFDYMRFGHQAILECVWCDRSIDYLVYSLPLILAPYTLEAVFLGIFGLGKFGGREGRKRAGEWRWVSGVGLGVMAVGEIGARYLWDLRPVNGDVAHLSTTISTIRNVVLLLYPLAYTFFPLSSAKPDMADFIPTLINVQNTLRLSSLSKTAIKRDPRYRRIWTASAEEETRQASQVRSDPIVLEAMKSADVDVEGARQGARRWVQEGWTSLVKVEQ